MLYSCGLGRRARRVLLIIQIEDVRRKIYEGVHPVDCSVKLKYRYAFKGLCGKCTIKKIKLIDIYRFWGINVYNYI